VSVRFNLSALRQIKWYEIVQDLRIRIQNRTGTAAIAPAQFYAFQNSEENVRHQLQKLRTHPWIPKAVAIRGFVYDVAEGFLREIKDA
jgi:carbonic anhydrase